MKRENRGQERGGQKIHRDVRHTNQWPCVDHILTLVLAIGCQIYEVPGKTQNASWVFNGNIESL